MIEHGTNIFRINETRGNITLLSPAPECGIFCHVFSQFLNKNDLDIPIPNGNAHGFQGAELLISIHPQES